MPATTPIACSLSPEQLRADRHALLPGLAAQALKRTPLPRGMRFTFFPTAARLRQIDDVARRERACCEFLDFRVGVSPGGAHVVLDVTGPEGTAEFLQELLAGDPTTTSLRSA